MAPVRFPVNDGLFHYAAQKLGGEYARFEWRDGGVRGKFEEGELYRDGQSVNSHEYRRITSRIRREGETLARRAMAFAASPAIPELRVYERGTGPSSNEPFLNLPSADDLMAVLTRYLAVPSHSCQEGAVARFFMEDLKTRGFEQVRQDEAGSKIQCAGDFTGGKTVQGETGNVLAVLKGDPQLPSVQLSVHLDRTEPQIAPVPMVREGNVVRVAPGNSTILGGDDVAGIALLLTVVDYLKAHQIPHGDIHVTGLVSEETGGDGAQQLAYADMQGDFAFVLDGLLSHEVIYGGSDIYTWDLSVRGKGEHVSLAPDGVDASEVAGQVRTKGWRLQDGKHHGDPKTLIVATTTRCGTAYKKTTDGVETEDVEGRNSVPDLCLMSGQVRTGVVESQERVINRMQQEAQKVCQKFGATCEFSAKLRLPGFQDPTTPLLAVVGAGYRRAELPKPKFRVHHAGSNANLLFPKRGNIVVLGIGSSKMHTAQESLDLDDTGKVLKALIGVFQELSTYRRVSVGSP